MMRCALAKGRARQLRKMARKLMMTHVKYFGSRKHEEHTMLSIMIPGNQDWPLQRDVFVLFSNWWEPLRFEYTTETLTNLLN